MSSTLDNPGAFQRADSLALGTIVRRCLHRLRRGEVRVAALGIAVDTANWIDERRHPDSKFRCSCCGFESHAFRHVLSGGHLVWNSACPGCNSRSRHRGLAILLPRLIAELAPQRALHFAPEPVLRRCFATVPRYETADRFLDDATHPGVDIQRVPFADASYDLVVCNHVLEHVPDDAAGLHEVARILAPNGAAVITVPGDFRRDKTTYFHGDLPNGHYRDYGRDFIEKLRQVFSRVDVVDLHELDRTDDALSRAIRPGDLAFVCQN